MRGDVEVFSSLAGFDKHNFSTVVLVDVHLLDVLKLAVTADSIRILLLWDLVDRLAFVELLHVGWHVCNHLSF